MHGDDPDFMEQENAAQDIPARPRSTSYDTDEAVLSGDMASLQVNTSSAPGANSYPRSIAPLSAESNGRFSSYSLTRGRAVSPVVSNYFGLPPDRESDKTRTAQRLGDQTSNRNEDDTAGEPGFWGTKLKYPYGLLGKKTESVDGTSDDEDSAADEDENDEDDEDEDDDDDGIDIFGHR